MKKTIITISRQFGSGGRTVGHLIAEKLGIPFYDKELVEQIAVDSGFAPRRKTGIHCYLLYKFFIVKGNTQFFCNQVANGSAAAAKLPTDRNNGLFHDGSSLCCRY